MDEKIPIQEVRDYRLRQLRTSLAAAMNTFKEYDVQPVLERPTITNLTRLDRTVDSLIRIQLAIEELEKLE